MNFNQHTAHRIIMLASLLCGLGVILGAFGAHTLRPMLSVTMLDAYQTGVFYQFIHALALLFVGLYVLSICKSQQTITRGSKLLRGSIVFFIVGIVLFSGSLYTMSMIYAYSATAHIPYIIALCTPLGGVCFIVAWCLLTFFAHQWAKPSL